MIKQEAIDFLEKISDEYILGIENPFDIAIECIQRCIDEEKTKHGYWDGSECSVCHDDLSYYQYDMPNIVYPYCPFCGAKMDIEKK